MLRAKGARISYANQKSLSTAELLENIWIPLEAPGGYLPAFPLSSMIAGQKGRRDEPEPCHACEKLTAANRMALPTEPEKTGLLTPCEKAVIASITQLLSVFLQNHGTRFLTPDALD